MKKKQTTQEKLEATTGRTVEALEKSARNLFLIDDKLGFLQMVAGSTARIADATETLVGHAFLQAQQQKRIADILNETNRNLTRHASRIADALEAQGARDDLRESVDLHKPS